MSKLKKSSPNQTEAEPSIVSQVPSDKMDDFLQGLIDLAIKKKAAAQSSTPVPTTEHPGEPSEIPDPPPYRKE